MSPVLVWDIEDGKPHGVVETDWEFRWTPEEFRAQAELLDRLLDEVLDKASAYARRHKNGAPARAQFTRAWAIGRSLNESRILNSEPMNRERPERLWKALAAKCRIGIRSTGETEPEWRELRPSTERRPRREGGRLDYFEMCRWLSEQEFHEAQMVFGGSIRNVWQMLERPALRPLVVRQGLLSWLTSLTQDEARRMSDPKMFPELMKALRQRWPDRGPGSAKRPSHYDEESLRDEISRILRPYAEVDDSRPATSSRRSAPR